MKHDVVTVGDSVVDIILPVERFPCENEDSVSGGKMEKQLGGASNFLIMASRLGLKVGIIDCIGDDDLGELYVKTLRSEGVDVSKLIVREGFATSHCIVMVDKQGNHAYIGFPGATSHLTSEEIDQDYISNAKVVYASGYALGDASLRQALLYALSIAYDYEVPIYFDPSPIINRIPKQDLWKTILTSKVMLLNERELRIITETSDLDEGIRTLLNSGPQIIVVKQGEKGCLLCNQSRSEQVLSFSVKVVDTTGAGDSFNAAFVFGQLKEWSIRETALFANAVGAIKVTKLGAGIQVPTKAEVDHFLTRHKIDVKGVR